MSRQTEPKLFQHEFSRHEDAPMPKCETDARTEAERIAHAKAYAKAYASESRKFNRRGNTEAYLRHLGAKFA